MEQTKQQTSGELLCGVSFNPSQNPKVDLVKSLFAQIADITIQEYEEKFGNKSVENGFIASQIYSHSLGEILNAQMSCVKLLTFK